MLGFNLMNDYLQNILINPINIFSFLIFILLVIFFKKFTQPDRKLQKSQSIIFYILASILLLSSISFTIYGYWFANVFNQSAYWYKKIPSNITHKIYKPNLSSSTYKLFSINTKSNIKILNDNHDLKAVLLSYQGKNLPTFVIYEADVESNFDLENIIYGNKNNNIIISLMSVNGIPAYELTSNSSKSSQLFFIMPGNVLIKILSTVTSKSELPDENYLIKFAESLK